MTNPQWKRFPEKFQIELQEFLVSFQICEEVFVHGDLWADNVLINEKNEIFILDFADACLAPICYEYALIACDLFAFDGDFLSGFFGEYEAVDLAEMIFQGLLLHESGGDVVIEKLGRADEIGSMEVLKGIICERLQKK
jgi:hypothetical protein